MRSIRNREMQFSASARKKKARCAGTCSHGVAGSATRFTSAFSTANGSRRNSDWKLVFVRENLEYCSQHREFVGYSIRLDRPTTRSPWAKCAKIFTASFTGPACGMEKFGVCKSQIHPNTRWNYARR